MSSQNATQTSSHDGKNKTVPQHLTTSNLAAHDASTATVSHGLTTMQRWLASSDDPSVRGRTMERRCDNQTQGGGAAQIERICQLAAVATKAEKKEKKKEKETW